MIDFLIRDKGDRSIRMVPKVVQSHDSGSYRGKNSKSYLFAAPRRSLLVYFYIIVIYEIFFHTFRTMNDRNLQTANFTSGTSKLCFLKRMAFTL